ncbi:MAG: hypothetical protein PWP40_2644 [Rhodocyclaceae bacterium]|nr:hypothetical protein [Rhodocyclaceae bacterium]
MQEARTIALPIECWVWPMHQTMVLGRFSAMVRAASSIWSSGTPQASSTLSGVHLASTSSRILSMPNTRSSMYCLSSQPFWKMWYSRPNRKGTSVPERMRMYWWALAAVRVKRGSTTIIFAPFSLACRMCSSDTGCASAAFEPMNSIAFAFCMSL